MYAKALISCLLAVASGAVLAEDAPAPSKEVKTLSGMSVLGNQEAPTSLVIVPWKSSEMGAGIGVSKGLDKTIRPVDKDVFKRELRYYEIRSSSAKQDGK